MTSTAATIRRQRRELSWWQILLGLIAFGLFLGMLLQFSNPPTPPALEDASRMTLEERVAGIRQATAPTEQDRLPLAAIRTQPETYSNQEVAGLARFGPVVSNDSFWINDEETSLLVVHAPGTLPELSTYYRLGDPVWVEGTIRPAAQVAQSVQDPESRQTVLNQSVVLWVKSVKPLNRNE